MRRNNFMLARTNKALGTAAIELGNRCSIRLSYGTAPTVSSTWLDRLANAMGYAAIRWIYGGYAIAVLVGVISATAFSWC